MSSVPTLERVRRKMESVLNEDIADALKYQLSPLVQFRAVISARKQLAEVEIMLSQVEEGLTTSASEEWESLQNAWEL